MNKTRSIITAFDVITKENMSAYTPKAINDRILSHLLNEYVDKICEDDYDPISEDPDGTWFHKMFRQTDVISADIDMAIWLSLQNSSTFWEIVDKKSCE